MSKVETVAEAAIGEYQETAADYQLDDQIGFILRLASQRHVSIFQNLSPGGLTPTQFATLIRVVEMGECSQNHLGRMVSMDVATIKGVVDRLKKKGLVRLAPDLNDKRRTTITPSDTAKQMVGELHELGLRISEETMQPLTAKERATLMRLLRKII